MIPELAALAADAAALAARWLTTDHTDTFDHPLDLTESVRARIIREAEWQARCDEESRVMRVSGKPHRGRYPLRRIRAR